MNWTMVLVAVGGIGALALLKQLIQVRSGAARTYLREGGLVIDVRSPGEFQSGHLPGAINLPLDQIEADIKKQGWKPEQILLLHCLSGGRSAMGVRTLKRMGYRRSFNLGSYGRAKRIAERAKQS